MKTFTKGFVIGAVLTWSLPIFRGIRIGFRDGINEAMLDHLSNAGLVYKTSKAKL